MKKILLSLLLLTPFFAKAQNTSLAKTHEVYCVLSSVDGNKTKLSIDFGQTDLPWKTAHQQEINDTFNKVMKMNNITDALNYLGSKGWKLASAYAYIINHALDESKQNFIMKMEY